MLLIPGAFMATDSMTSWVSAFAGKRAVIVFDQQGHGRTPDTSRKMSYEQFADDAAALLRALKVERADVMGYSQGGGVALQLALRHPTLVNKLVSLSATYRQDGWYPSVLKGIEGLSANAFAGTPVEQAFKGHTPDATAFDAYLEKVKVLNVDDQNISDAQMRSISAMTMVIVGDADGVKPEHALAMFELRRGGDEEAAASGMLQKVPAARLVILPAASHIDRHLSGETAVLVPMVSAFLDDVPPADAGSLLGFAGTAGAKSFACGGPSVDGKTGRTSSFSANRFTVVVRARPAAVLPALPHRTPPQVYAVRMVG